MSIRSSWSLRLTVIASNHLLAKGITIDLAAGFPCIFDQLGLPLILLRSLAQLSLQPGIEPAWLDREAAAHGTDRKDRAMLGHERVLHLFGVALGPMAGSRLTLDEVRGRFFKISRSSVIRASSRFSRRTSAA